MDYLSLIANIGASADNEAMQAPANDVPHVVDVENVERHGGHDGVSTGSTVTSTPSTILAIPAPRRNAPGTALPSQMVPMIQGLIDELRRHGAEVSVIGSELHVCSRQPVPSVMLNAVRARRQAIREYLLCPNCQTNYSPYPPYAWCWPCNKAAYEGVRKRPRWMDCA